MISNNEIVGMIHLPKQPRLSAHRAEKIGAV